MLPLLRVARDRGDEILVAGPHALRDMVIESGFAFWGCGEPTEAEIAPIREQFATASREVASVLGNRELFGRMAAGAMLPELTRAYVDWNPDFVLRDPCEYASAILAKRRKVQTATVAISLSSAEDGSIRAAEPALEDHEPDLTNFVRSLPYLTRFPERLDPDQMPNTIRFRETLDTKTTPLPDWWNGSDAPLVYLTFGTVFGYMSFAGDVLRVALDAVADLDARVLVTVGHKFDPSQLGPISANTHVERWVDQCDVFEAASIVVCHGGSGTSLGALSAGLPLVIHPMFSDQFVNAQMVADSGAGETVHQRDSAAFAASVRRVLSNDVYQQRAQRIAGEMATMPSLKMALEQAFGN
jgi:UDP-glucoronosyl and UDP-glucosyl transferase